MKNIFIIVLIGMAILLPSCINDLERIDAVEIDNPSTTYLSISEVTVATRFVVLDDNGWGEYQNENIIEHGNTIWLGVKLRNNTNSTISKIRGVIFSESSLISLEPIGVDNYLTFVSVHHENEYINSSNEGWGVLKPLAESSNYLGTMTGEFFACEFSVSETAISGDSIGFNLHLTADGYANELDLPFTINID